MKQFFLITLAFIISVNLHASQYYKMDFGEYEVSTLDQKIYQLLKYDLCARTIMREMKTKVLDPIEMEKGVDLTSMVDLAFFMKLKSVGDAKISTYSITANDVSRLAQVSKMGRKCKVLSLYTAGDI